MLDIATANMRQADVIAVLGRPSSPEALLAALPQLQDLGVPVFTTVSSDTLLLQDTSGRIFRSVAQELLRSRALADLFGPVARRQPDRRQFSLMPQVPRA